MNVTFRGGCVEDESGAKWWSAELLAKVEKERDEAQARVIDAALIHADLVRERDEARAEVERLKAQHLELTKIIG